MQQIETPWLDNKPIESETAAVRLITVTPNGEALMAYTARVSSPNQKNPDYAKLLRYCIKNKHWSVFEHAFLTVEIATSRAITQQIVRHRSFTFQEFSQRYASALEGIVYGARRQAKKNRQSSVDDLDAETKEWFKQAQEKIWKHSNLLYMDAIDRGIAKECARMVLPMATISKIYMTGNVRSWIHYLDLRTQPNVQLEHREIAEMIKSIFIEQFPVCSEAMGWTTEKCPWCGNEYPIGAHDQRDCMIEYQAWEEGK